MDIKTMVQEFLALPKIADIIAQTGYLDKVYDEWNSYYASRNDYAIAPEALTAYLNTLNINIIDYFESCLPSHVFSYQPEMNGVEEPYELGQIVNLPERISEIETFAFNNQPKLETFFISDNSQLTTIGLFAFYHCKKLKHFTFPRKLRSIGHGAFHECPNLNHLIFKSASSIDTVAHSGDIFNDYSQLKVISIEQGCVQAIIQYLTSSMVYKTVEVLQYAGSIDDFMQEFYMHYPKSHSIFTYLPTLSEIHFMQGNQQVLVNQAE